MSFDYTMNKKDLKKMYVKDYSKINIIYLFLASFLFIIFMFDMIKYNFIFFTISYIVLLIVLTFILYFLDLIYAAALVRINDKKNNHYGGFKVEMNEKEIISKNDDYELKINWNQIQKIIYKKNKIYIKYQNKDKLVFLINKDFLNNKNDFEKIKKYLKNI